MHSLTLTDLAQPSENELVSMVAHELGQPLQTLELACAAIQRRASTDAEISEFAQIAISSLQRVRELLKKMRDISRVEGARLQPDYQIVAVAEICEDLGRRFGPVARNKGLSFRWHAGRHFVRTDPTLLCGILSNLVTNAICYTNDGEVPRSVVARSRRAVQADVNAQPEAQTLRPSWRTR